jgi:hypothetical protein
VGAVAVGSGNATFDASNNADSANTATFTGFSAASLVSVSQLDSQVTGNTVLSSAESGMQSQIMISDNAFQYFAGAQSYNINTGHNASQNANVSISARIDSLSMGDISSCGCENGQGPAAQP